jgi:2-dehydro-3-deoxyphosphooctonate aldolase (KDO 8-P synthase)
MMTTPKINIGDVSIGGGGPLLIIAGPCVLEGDDVTIPTARALKEICAELELPFVFKSSFDKGNRTSIDSFRGPGMEQGLRTLYDIKQSLGIPVITDIHTPQQAAPVAEVLDAMQIPAFLCRQTDLIVAASKSNIPVNIKKGQFLAPWDVQNIVDKFRSAGGDNLIITERGTSFGYNNLVVDFRGFPVIQSCGVPLIFDVTHSLQLPGGQGTTTGGQREFAPHMMRAAAAVGVDGLFLEVHPDPDNAKCDGTNMIKLDDVKEMLKTAKAISSLSE